MTSLESYSATWNLNIRVCIIDQNVLRCNLNSFEITEAKWNFTENIKELYNIFQVQTIFFI